MARGKYGARAAKKRAESAEEQLDRLLPKLVDTERQLKRYRSEAEAAPVLRKRIAELEQQVGVPMPTHLQALKNLEDKFAAQRAEEAKAWEEIIFKFDEAMRQSSVVIMQYLRNSNWISGVFLQALRQIPRPLALRVLSVFGVDRDNRRGMLEGNMASRATAENMPEVLLLEKIAQAEGHKGITEGMLHPPDHPLAGDVEDFDAEAAAIPD